MRYLVFGDVHYRSDRPVSRIDENFLENQDDALNQVFDLAESLNAIPLCTGDIFHRGPSGVELVNRILNILNRMISIPGNHDLSEHSYDLVDRYAYGILMKAGVFLETPPNIELCPFSIVPKGNREIVVMHKLIVEGSSPIPGTITAKELSESFAETPVKWVFTGDNHKNFVYIPPLGSGLPVVVNPGCLQRHSYGERDYTPGVYLVDTEESTIEHILIDDGAVFTADVVTKRQQKEIEKSDVQAFVELFKGDHEGLGFEECLKSVYTDMEKMGNPVSRKIKARIASYLEVLK